MKLTQLFEQEIIVANPDLDAMSLADLRKLKKDVERAIESYQERRRFEAATELESLAREKGFTLAELTGAVRKKRKVVAVKYRHPDDSSLTWSGRGRRPRWVTAALARGVSLETLAV